MVIEGCEEGVEFVALEGVDLAAREALCGQDVADEARLGVDGL